MRLTAQQAEERRAKVLELRAQRLSWRAIGKLVGLTGARCQQIAAGKSGHESRPPKPETMRRYINKRASEAEEHFRTIEAMLKAGLCE